MPMPKDLWTPEEKEIKRLRAENERIRAALSWYADEARACAKHSADKSFSAPQALLASVTVLALDGGRRADEALKPNVEVQPRAEAAGWSESAATTGCAWPHKEQDDASN